MKPSRRVVLLFALILLLAVTYGSLRADSGTCGGASLSVPFTDVASSFAFCFIAEAYNCGLTAGTSATTFSPTSVVTREQMAVFITRAQDSALNRGSRRAALNQWWTTTPHFDFGLGTTIAPGTPRACVSDGADVWVLDSGGAVRRFRASDGSLLGSWTGQFTPFAGVLSAMGRIFVAAGDAPAMLYMIDPSQPPGAVEPLAVQLGYFPQGIAFDGNRIWTANHEGSVSIIPPGAGTQWLVSTVRTGFSAPQGILFDGSNIWVTDDAAGTLLRLDSNGSILQTVTVGSHPYFPVFDGTNIWVPNSGSNTVTVVRAGTGAVVATLTGNGLNGPYNASFDGQRILVTNLLGNSVSLWKAADTTPLGTFSTGTGSQPEGTCSDGLNFWIALSGVGKLARF